MILLTGATGYIGGRLLKVLEARGERIRCMVRNPQYMLSKVSQKTEVVEGDVLKPERLLKIFEGVDTAYYLIHSMGAGKEFRQRDHDAASNFAKAAKIADVNRIIYVGGLGNDKNALSPHLKSRQEVGEILRGCGVPVIELRASIVIGSGSLSFEMIRSLVERLPVMVTPKWVSRLAQPIAINDLISYLLEAKDLPEETCRVYEIGGADQVSYADIMRIYGVSRGMKVHMIPVPVLTPYLSSLWLGLITPLYARIGRQLIESIVHSTIVQDFSAKEVFNVNPVGIEVAIQQALCNEDKEFAETRWSDALSSTGEQKSGFGIKFGSRMLDSRVAEVNASAKKAFVPIQRIGGATGWYSWNFLWCLRGWLDLLVGGIGMRRGRSHPTELAIGDTVDFWRVEAYEQDRLLRLTAEMKVPGRAWLEFEVIEQDGQTTIRQTAIFDPLGFYGRVYWYVLYPLHQLVFGGMLRNIVSSIDIASHPLCCEGNE